MDFICVELEIESDEFEINPDETINATIGALAHGGNEGEGEGDIKGKGVESAGKMMKIQPMIALDSCMILGTNMMYFLHFKCQSMT